MPSNHHDFAHSSTSSNFPQSTNSRSLLPHGIVPLPPPHKNAHNNGFHQYRLTQKDLLQPQRPGPANENATPPPPAPPTRDLTKDESNPVMRSASFNLDYGAARRHQYRFRSSHINSNASQQHNRPITGRSPHQKQAQQAIVLLAENPESGACDVYNVPFQSDIYSLPVDTIASAVKNDAPKIANTSSATAAFSNNGTSSQVKQNQRLNSEAVISSNNFKVDTPPPRKNHTNRRKSRDYDGDGSQNGHGFNHMSSQSKDLLPQHVAHQPRAVTAEGSSEICTPPQRWSSLAVQPRPPSPLLKDLPASPSPTPPSTLFPGTSSKQSTTILNHQKSIDFTSSNGNAKCEQRLNLEKPVGVGNSTSIAGGACGLKPTTNCNSSCSVSSSSNPAVPKKPRSRSVDPTNESEHQYRQCAKRTVNSTIVNNSTSTINVNFDNPNNLPSVGTSSGDPLALPSESEHSCPNVLLGNSNKESTNDRRNPLGLSFLNLFRRNKTGKPPNPNARPDFDSNDDFGHTGGGGNTSMDETGAAPSFTNNNGGIVNNNNKEDTSYYFRELPPPPPGHHSESSSDEQGSPTASPVECRDFAASIEKVKDCGWYWGPLSSEAAEDLLKTEPDGSFIVRDSSDARYIFSLTFKLHGLVRHVRIEHDQGNFSFGPLTRFKAATIVDFVEKAVAHSRSGRYLFFLHRRPVLGPMQVQLLHPYSRFMHPRSLKHMCRYFNFQYKCQQI